MNDLSKQIDKIIKEELSTINDKISGVFLLEILKYKVLDKFKDQINHNLLEKIGNLKENFQIENLNRKININIISNEVVNITPKKILNNNLLIICINELIKINIEDFETKKIFSFNCLPMTGVVISKDSTCSFIYDKKSIFLEIILKDE